MSHSVWTEASFLGAIAPYIQHLFLGAVAIVALSVAGIFGFFAWKSARGENWEGPKYRMMKSN